MSERGVFAVDRGIWDHDLLADSEPFSRREAWLWLVSEAAWKAHRRRIIGRPIDLDRGQLVASTRFIASKWRWSEARVRRFLTALISERMIDAKTDAGVNVITICKYDEYQRVSLPSDAMRESDDDAGATQERRKVEGKEYKEDIFSGETRAREKPTSDWDFDRFWQRYPHKVGKQDAAKAFKAAAKCGKPFADVMAALDRYIAGKPPDRAWCNPSTWLRGGRWDDAPAADDGIPAFLDRRKNYAKSGIIDAADRALANIRAAAEPSAGVGSQAALRLVSQGGGERS